MGGRDDHKRKEVHPSRQSPAVIVDWSEGDDTILGVLDRIE